MGQTNYEWVYQLIDKVTALLGLESVNWQAVIALVVIFVAIWYLFFKRDRVNNQIIRTEGSNSPIDMSKKSDGAHYLFLLFLVFISLLSIIVVFFIIKNTNNTATLGSSSANERQMPLTQENKPHNIPEMIVTVSGISEEEKGKANISIERLSNNQTPLFEGIQPTFNSAKDFYYFSNLKGNYNEKVKITISLKGYRTTSKEEFLGKSVPFYLKRSL